MVSITIQRIFHEVSQSGSNPRGKQSGSVLSTIKHYCAIGGDVRLMHCMRQPVHKPAEGRICAGGQSPAQALQRAGGQWGKGREKTGRGILRWAMGGRWAEGRSEERGRGARI